MSSNIICAVRFISHNYTVTYINCGQNVNSNSAIRYIATGKKEFYGIAQPINQRMYLCVFPAT